MTATPRDYKAMVAGESRAREAAQLREKQAIVRAERAEQAERNLTAALDRAHRELDRLRAETASLGK
jgi:hypothetical protein